MKSNYLIIQQRLEEFQAQLTANTYPPSQLTIAVSLPRVEQFTKEQVPPKVYSALEYIHDHLFDRKLTIAYLKKNCNINGNNLSTAFTYYEGKTPKKYINLLRVEAAARLLQTNKLSGVPLSHIAAYVGFNRPSTFSKAFKRLIGQTPGEWRQNQLE